MAPNNFFGIGIFRILEDAQRRGIAIANSVFFPVAAVILGFPVAAAQQPTGYYELNTSNPSYYGFTAAQVGDDVDGFKVRADVQSLHSSGKSNNWTAWVQRSSQIRKYDNAEWCIGNLSIALSGLGSAYQASAAGATTLLTLLPTAGALIGAPTKELWVLYKLMPLAGVLSMVLSLGGNIVPMEVNQYERVDSFAYAGMVGSIAKEQPVHPSSASKTKGLTQAQEFAEQVHAKSVDFTGSRKGTIITIVEQMKPWMLFWYFFAACSSLLDNLAGVPFTRQYTIRVSRAPKIRISDDAPWVISEHALDEKLPDSNAQAGLNKPLPDPNGATPTLVANKAAAKISTATTISTVPLTPSTTSLHSINLGQVPGGNYQPLPQTAHSTHVDTLAGFVKGYNTYGRVIMDPNEPWAAQSTPFYVIISIHGISNAHATLRVFSKFLSIGVFTVGTAMFASCAFVTILVAVAVASLTLVAGIFGRVTAMWMASELMQNEPVIHRVVTTYAEANQMVEAMLRKPGVMFEVLGHLVVDGRCVKGYRHHIRWSKILGVLASPYDISLLAMPGTVGPRKQRKWF
ncbi:hypothetical protein BAUCODRAFT_135834 [Baudoinia panamericana UAMH 10762]|uniref:Uncharacterized protein n=1 Tax=Baudoinia panamericana (strain UAMH 10762) TaxID=717646 RepID=M2M201_BAUPA|nr:uncharacterized protein BAUCODRAFT_135834 [Baudoinia panamericana UAMH 10762]EMD01098.1 hypothetical protein BAUCODRAFT_135834 [Baudoinia panamericana UAMH 10762]